MKWHEQRIRQNPGWGLQLHTLAVDHSPSVVGYDHGNPLAVPKSYDGKIAVVHNETKFVLQRRRRQSEPASQQRQGRL